MWEEIQPKKRNAAKKRRTSDEEEDKKRADEAIALARWGLPGKAIQILQSEGLAPDTAETKRIMYSKFPPPPAHQAASARLAAPPANNLSEEIVAKAIHASASGAAQGPSGQRLDLYRL